MADKLGDGTLALAEALDERLAPVAASTPAEAYLASKRLFDLAISGFLLLLTLPLFVVIAAAIRLESPGPSIFRQQRIGKDGRVFTIYKFRTMFAAAPAYSYKVSIDDPRITRLGTWLRRSGLDELPQLWNVLRGDMSLIGPRPELPFIVEQYQGWNHPRHAIRPGITGWWQIHHRDCIPMHLNLDYDLYYLEHLSLGLDWRIAVSTVTLIIKGLFRAA